MEPGILILVAFLALITCIGAAFFIFQAKAAAGSDRKIDIDDDEEGVEVANVGNRAGRRQGARGRIGAANLRHRHQQAQPAQALRNIADDTDSEVTEDEESETEEGGRRKKESKKDRKRREKRERQEERDEQRRLEEQRRTQPTAYEERMRQREAEREAKERAEEEELRRIAEEKQRREDEEAAKWMGKIQIEDEGQEDPAASLDNSTVLGQFVEYIRSRKTVPLEQLATDFKLRTTDVIDRIHSLEEQGLLTGVMDERGKYIYISMDEMKAVADYLTQKGRMSITELATKSATLIDLEPKTAAVGVLHGAGDGLDFDAVLAA